MPYVASIFVFVWLLNMTSFVPLPLNTHDNIGDVDFLYAFGVYAVTSNIFCTITLALLTFAIYHYEGVKAHGLIGYLKTWSAGQTGPVLHPRVSRRDPHQPGAQAGLARSPTVRQHAERPHADPADDGACRASSAAR